MQKFKHKKELICYARAGMGLEDGVLWLSDADAALAVLLFFFFQAEDGIRDGTVTGVQTCALPIFSALDVRTRQRLRTEILRIWRETQKTILFVTHDLDEALFLADRIVVFSNKPTRDRKSTRLNSSHSSISYAVFCLKKKK